MIAPRHQLPGICGIALGFVLLAACSDGGAGPLAAAAVDAAAGTTGVADAPATTCVPGGDGTYLAAAYPRLSDYCLVAIGAGGELRFAEGALPYEARNPLFTDHARKSRALWLPPGTRAAYAAEGAFTLPVGAILIKSFGYTPPDGAVPRWIETRLLVHAPDGWVGYAYAWEGAEATLRPGGGFVDVDLLDDAGLRRHTTHQIPSQNQCRKCHADGTAIAPIGLRASQLEPEVVADWARLGKLDGAPAVPPAREAAWPDPSSGTAGERARAYLEANCAHCHNPRGAARTTGLDLRRSVREPYSFGVCKSPVAAGRATGGLAYDVVPGAPEESILLYRLRSTEPSVMMPEIGRHLVHDAGNALVAEWITGLAGGCRPGP